MSMSCRGRQSDHERRPHYRLSTNDDSLATMVVYSLDCFGVVVRLSTLTEALSLGGFAFNLG